MREGLRCNGKTLAGPLRPASFFTSMNPEPFRRLRSATVIWVGILLLIGCRTPSREVALQRYEFRSPLMGTLVSITMYAADYLSATNAASTAFSRIAALERMMSDYDPDSELMQVCQQPVGLPTPVSNELFEVLSKALQLARVTDGAFDPTAGPYVRLWRRARRTQTLPSTNWLAVAGQSVGWKKLRLDSRNKTVTLAVPGMQLDLGGLAKGYAADQALQVLKKLGITRALVAAGGDIAVGDPPPGKRGWRIGIAAPECGNRAPVKMVLLRNSAVSTSGDTEQFVEINGVRYSHIVNPKTGIGLTNRIQVSIFGKDAVTTDSFATAVCVLGVKHGLTLVESRQDLAALILRKTGDKLEVFASSRFHKIPSVD